MKPNLTGMARIIAAFHNSRAGLRDIWQREAAFRQEVGLLVLGIPLAVWIGDGFAQTGLLIGSILFLMLVEILNSAIEAVVDRIGTDIHELSRIAKDLGSAAVLMASLFPLAVWVTLILNKAGVISV
jgi:diacylglycerol kinase (ATP)